MNDFVLRSTIPPCRENGYVVIRHCFYDKKKFVVSCISREIIFVRIAKTMEGRSKTIDRYCKWTGTPVKTTIDKRMVGHENKRFESMVNLWQKDMRVLIMAACIT